MAELSLLRLIYRVSSNKCAVIYQAFLLSNVFKIV